MGTHAPIPGAPKPVIEEGSLSLAERVVTTESARGLGRLWARPDTYRVLLSGFGTYADGLAGGLADRLADGVEQAAKIRLAQAAHALDVDVLLLAGGEERPAWCLPADLAPPAGR